MAVFKNGLFASYNGEIINPVNNIAASVAANNFFQSAGITNQQQRYAVYNLVADLQSYSIWDKMKAIYPFVGQPEVTSSFEVNLKDPTTFRGTFYGTWSFADTGITPDGETAYMSTGLIPSSQFNTINDGNFGYYHRTSMKSNSTVVGAASGGNYVMDWIAGSAGSFPSINDGNSAALNYANNIKGFRQISRNSLNVNQILYKLNTTDYSVTQAPTGRPTNQIYVGSAGTLFYSDSEIAFVYIGDTSLTTTEQSNFYTAVQRFQTTLGRQV